MDVSNLVWAVTIGAIAALILVDLFTVSSKPHDVMFKEATLWSIFYIGIAIIFGMWVWSSYGSQFGTEYFAAYLVEKSLSVDNLFVFVIILTQFAVPSIYHQRVLLIGVMLALVLRAIFIAVGAAALAAFSFTFVIFGAILIWTGVGLFRHWDEDPDPSENFIVKRVRKRMATVDEYHGTKLFIRQNGKRFATPMFLVMISIGATDLLFALDSIPAIFGLTKDPYIVFTANAFALMGLRQLYFLIGGLMTKLIYLTKGLAIILGFIGVKLIIEAIHGNDIHKILGVEIPEISTQFSLTVIVGTLVTTTIASLIVSSKSKVAE